MDLRCRHRGVLACMFKSREAPGTERTEEVRLAGLTGGASALV